MTLHIMVVDDEPDVTDLFRQQFRRELRAGRFAMGFAHSGSEALEHISLVEEASLIMVCTDINMPGMTGLEFLPKVKAMRPNVPVMMITAYGDEDTRRRALEGGAVGLMTKPIDFGALRLEIDRRLGERDT
jgi:CheY-like chemotaxis protein